jgi:hypothetical protein
MKLAWVHFFDGEMIVRPMSWRELCHFLSDAPWDDAVSAGHLPCDFMFANSSGALSFTICRSSHPDSVSLLAQFHPQERRLLDFFIDTDSTIVIAVPSHVLVVLLDPTSPTFIDAFNGISPALFCVHNPEPATLQRLGIAPTFQLYRSADPSLCDRIRAIITRLCPSPTAGSPLLFRNFFARMSRMASVLAAPDFAHLTTTACPVCGGEFPEPLARLCHWQRVHGVRVQAAFGPPDRTGAHKCRVCGTAVRAEAFVEHIIRDGARARAIIEQQLIEACPDRHFDIALYFTADARQSAAAKGQSRFIWRANDEEKQRPFVIAEPDDPAMPHFWETLEAGEAALRRDDKIRVDVRTQQITCVACGVGFRLIGDFLQHCWSQH